MSKTFRSWDVDQPLLLPPSVEELVPASHLAHFIRETVRESLSLSAIVATYEEERGYPPYHPVMMTALLLYAYCQGIYSSRRIARAWSGWTSGRSRRIRPQISGPLRSSGSGIWRRWGRCLAKS
jgi:hypothetical protein